MMHQKWCIVQQRYEILKSKNINLVAKTNSKKMGVAEQKYKISESYSISETDRKKLFKKLGEEFGVFKEYENKDVKLSFVFSRGNMAESENKQKGNYESFAKMFTCFDKVIDSAIGIEIHNRNDEGYKVDPTLKDIYVLVSAFEDGEYIIPVKLEIKEFIDKNNSLYVAIALESIKKDEVVKEGDTINGVTQASRSSKISLAQLFRNINPSDETFLKYVPKQFLAVEQYSDRDTAYISTRELLTNALDSVTQNDAEKELLDEYREKIDIIAIKESELTEINSQIKELSFAPGKRDVKKLEYLRNRAERIRNSINYYDKKLLTLEAAAPLKALIEREKAKARKKAYESAKEKGTQKLSSYKEAIEKKAKIQA